MHALSALTFGVVPFLATIATASPTCQNVTIPITISANNVQLPTTLTLQSLISFLGQGLGSLINTPITGSYSIFAEYCVPEVTVAAHKDVLQLLVHGSQRDHTYWNGYDYKVLTNNKAGTGQPYHGANYSWVEYASKQGYPTLAIDRLGNGQSSHPNPLTVVQFPAQVEAVHAVINQIKSGFLGRTFKETMYVGHSAGSVLGQLFITSYPNDVNRTILTGWTAVTTKVLQEGSAGNSSQPAASIYPARYGNLPAGYTITANETYASLQTYYGYASSFAGKYYDPAIPTLAYSGQGTSTVGEAYSQVLVAVEAPTSYKGRVYVLTGQHDAYFCGTFNSADCGTGASSTVAQSKSLFPSAKSYDYDVPANTGHEWNYHYTQQQSFAKVFNWIGTTA